MESSPDVARPLLLPPHQRPGAVRPHTTAPHGITRGGLLCYARGMVIRRPAGSPPAHLLPLELHDLRGGNKLRPVRPEGSLGVLGVLDARERAVKRNAVAL